MSPEDKEKEALETPKVCREGLLQSFAVKGTGKRPGAGGRQAMVGGGGGPFPKFGNRHAARGDLAEGEDSVIHGRG